MKRKLFFLFLTLLSVAGFTYTVSLINDSPFELTATVEAADGTFLGQEILQPGEQKQWSTNMKKTKVKEIYNASSSLTPFIVIWKCKYKGYYSVCTNVSPGSVVFASKCDGSKSCSPKEKKEKCPECPTCPTCPVCPTCPIEPKPSSSK